MKSAYIGIDVAIAREKYLPFVICTREKGRLTFKRSHTVMTYSAAPRANPLRLSSRFKCKPIRPGLWLHTPAALAICTPARSCRKRERNVSPEVTPVSRQLAGK